MILNTNEPTNYEARRERGEALTVPEQIMLERVICNHRAVYEVAAKSVGITEPIARVEQARFNADVQAAEARARAEYSAVAEAEAITAAATLEAGAAPVELTEAQQDAVSVQQGQQTVADQARTLIEKLLG